MSLERRTLVTTVYRAHHTRWSFAPTSGAGAALHGGRFDRPGLDCLYTSMTLGTAWLEAQQGFAFKAQPMRVCAYEVECADVLDLTVPTVREAARTSLDELGSAWEDDASRGREPATWRLADALRIEGIAGIVVPSFASRAVASDVNAVFWTWGPAPPHRVDVIDEAGRLPKNDASWR